MVGLLLADTDTSLRYSHCLFWLNFMLSVICQFSRVGNKSNKRLCSEILGIIRADDFWLPNKDGNASWLASW